MKFVRIFFPILLIACMASIFFLSAQPAKESTETSSKTIVFIAKIINPDFSELSEAEQQEFIDSMQNLVRKAAHALAFFALGMCAILSIVTYRSPVLIIKSVICLIFCVFYALSDEYHQTFVKGRSGELKDVLIDTAGAFAAILIVTVIAAIVKSSKNRKEKAILERNFFAHTEELEDRCLDYETKLSELKREKVRLEKEISALKSEKNVKTDEQQKSTPLKNIELKVAETVSLSDDTVLGSHFIGKIVLKATEYCNKLSENPSGQSKELVNLILGKTEVIKSEILDIVSSEASADIKKALMESKQKEAEDYFLSVLGQVT